MATPDTTTIPEQIGIDEYLRKRLLPVEGGIPQLARTDMYGDSIPQGASAAIFSSTSIFSSATTSTVGLRAH
jgi:hypothetical protein